MSIASEIQRLQGVKSDILEAIAEKGVTVPAGSALADCPTLIESISGGSYLSKVPARVWLSNGYVTAVYNYDMISCEPNPGQSPDYNNKMGVVPIIDDIKFSDIKESFEINLVIHVPSGGSWASTLIRNDNYRSPANMRFYALILEKNSSRIGLSIYLNGSTRTLFQSTGYVAPDRLRANITFYKSAGDWKVKVYLDNILKCDSIIDITGVDNESLAPAFGYSKDTASWGLPATSYVYSGTYIKKDGVLIWGNEV